MNTNLINLAKSKLLENLNEINSLEINYLFSTILLFDELNLKKKKLHIKKLKKNINYLFLNFDEVYLLISFNENYYLYDNLLFLELFDKLIKICEENNLNKLIDKLNDLKSKIELGFQRYFITKKKNLIINFNYKQENFEMINKKIIKTTTNNLNYLLYNLHKKYKNEKYKLDLTYAKYFPKYIYKNKNKEEIEILKSLFFKKELNFKELNKKHIILKDINSIEIIILILAINQ